MLILAMMMLPSPVPSHVPVHRLQTSGKEEMSIFYAAGSPIKEVLRFEQDGSVYLRGKLVGKDPAIARMVKQQSEGKR